MKIIIKLSFFTIISLSLLLTNTQHCQGTVVDRIVAVVNNDVITEKEVDALIFPVYTQIASTYEGSQLEERIQKVRLDAIQQLIDNKLVIAEAKKLKIEVAKEEIDELLNETKARFASEVEFETVLESQSLRLVDIMDRYKEQILLRKLIDRVIRKKVVVMPTDIVEYYNTHMNEFMTPLQAKVGLIVIKIANPKEERTKLDTADYILTQLKTGTEFAKLASKYSQGPNASNGGDLGYIKKGYMSDDLDKAIFSLDAGQFSGVIKTPVGYNIVMVYDKKPETTQALDEARAKISEKLFQEKSKTAVNDWISRLRKNAYISIK